MTRHQCGVNLHVSMTRVCCAHGCDLYFSFQYVRSSEKQFRGQPRDMTTLSPANRLRSLHCLDLLFPHKGVSNDTNDILWKPHMLQILKTMIAILLYERSQKRFRSYDKISYKISATGYIYYTNGQFGVKVLRWLGSNPDDNFERELIGYREFCKNLPVIKHGRARREKSNKELAAPAPYYILWAVLTGLLWNSPKLSMSGDWLLFNFYFENSFH